MFGRKGRISPPLGGSSDLDRFFFRGTVDESHSFGLSSETARFLSAFLTTVGQLVAVR